MNSIYILLLVIVALYTVPWILGKLLGRGGGLTGDHQSSEPVSPPRERNRKRRTRRRNESIRQEKEYPRYNPLRNDEVQWRAEIEPKYRKHVGLPPDWQRRRALVFLKDKEKCQGCGRFCGRLACEPNQLWNFAFDEHLLYEAEVHHAKHRSAGGDHALENLQLYCLRCHSNEHPDNPDLWARRAWIGLGGGNPENAYRRKAPKPVDRDVPF